MLKAGKKMAMKIVKTGEAEASGLRERLCRRGEWDQEEVEREVKDVLREVRRRGDQALIDFTFRFDGYRLEPAQLRVREEEIRAAYGEVRTEEIEALREACERIEAFHAGQGKSSWFAPGEREILGQIERPLRRIGIYVPGGKASYPSSVLMNAVPARVAGVEEIAMCTPAAPDLCISPWVLVAADMAGIREIYRVGGAQAIGALAYGTDTIPAVDKIVGPGNIYVAVAKQMVFGRVDIDMVAGPSEVLVYAEEGADPCLIAADLLSQAEHDERAYVLVVTPSALLAEAVCREVERQVQDLPRSSIVSKCLEDNGYILICGDRKEGVEWINAVAPEHLELMVEDPWPLVGSIRNAGAIFLGAFSPEVLGDYLAGPSHVLPTGGTARFSSPLGVDDFRKRSSLVFHSREALRNLGPSAIRLARLEGLEAHARAVEMRMRMEK
jgi:histidinol dehydrogenase